jgi:hypothetical protein
MAFSSTPAEKRICAGGGEAVGAQHAALGLELALALATGTYRARGLKGSVVMASASSGTSASVEA